MRILLTVLMGGMLVAALAVEGNCDQLSSYLADEGADLQLQSPQFVRGDADASGGFPDMFDALRILFWLGGEAPAPPCIKAADADDSGGAVPDMFDALRVLFWLGGEAAAPPPPCCSSPDDCGPDPTPDGMDCLSFPPCGWNP